MPRSIPARTVALLGRALVLWGVCLALTQPAEAQRKRGKRSSGRTAAAQPAAAEPAPAEQPAVPSEGSPGEPAGAGATPNGGQAPPGGVQLSPEEADRLAREHFEKGRADFDNGNYRDAWDHFHQAYGLSDRPALLYNIGQTADRLGRDADALAAFRLYLERRPDADNRREVENRIRALEDRARAEGQGGAGEAGADAPAAPPPGQPIREGFYLRMAFGLGFLINGRSVPDGTTLAGSASGAELWIGHSVLHGLALGGGLYLDFAFKANGSSDDPNATVDGGPLRLTMFGGGADWYPMPGKNGMHFQTALALARLMGDSLGTATPTGGAVLFGGGYEWPIAREWGIGVLGRMTLATLSDSGVDYKVLAATVQFSATWF